MTDRQPLPIVPVAENLTLTPSSVDLARAETQLISEPGRELVLKQCLEESGLGDDVLVILDCPPSLGVLALNCLTAADQVLVTMQPGGFELQALARLQQTVDVLKDRVNRKLSIVGVVLTNCWLRRSITEQTRDEVAQLFPVLGLVRSDAQLLYATTAGVLPELAKSAALDDYAIVAEELRKSLPWQKRLVA
jgi:chromosome partitioning protein